jgi:hypothetical protein
MNWYVISSCAGTVENSIVSNVRLKTSLNMFRHYKLKPSFLIIKDNKAKDRAGVGETQIMAGQLILIWPDFYTSSNFVWTNFIQIMPIWFILIFFDPIWANSMQFDLIWSNFIWFEPNYQSDPIWANFIRFEFSKVSNKHDKWLP